MGAARAYEVYQFALTHYCLPPTGQRLYYYRWIPSPQSELRRKNVVPLIQALTSLGFYNSLPSSLSSVHTLCIISPACLLPHKLSSRRSYSPHHLSA